MGPAFSWLLALRYLSSRWVNVLGMLGVAMAVWALIVVRCIFSGFIADIRVDVRNSSPDLLVTDLPHETGFEVPNEENRPCLRELLAADPDVVAAAPRLRHYGVFHQRRSSNRVASTEVDFSNVHNSFVQMLGVDPRLEQEVTPLAKWIDSGNQRIPGLGRQAAELGQELAVSDAAEYRARMRAGLAVPADQADFRAGWPGLLLGWARSRQMPWLLAGDPLDIVSVDFHGPTATAPGDVQPLQKVFAWAGCFETGALLFDETTAIVPIEPLRTMLGHDLTDHGSIDLITDIAIRARQGMSNRQLEAMAARLQLLVAAALPADAAPQVYTWEGQNVVFLDAIEVERSMMTIVLFVVMLIAAFLIYACLNMMVAQKVKDIGILSALGGSPRGTGAIFTRCGVVIGLAGCSIGTLLGLLSVWNLNPVLQYLGIELFPSDLFDLQTVPYEIDPQWILGIALSAFALTVLVSWLPARKAARMHPVKALSYE